MIDIRPALLPLLPNPWEWTPSLLIMVQTYVRTKIRTGQKLGEPLIILDNIDLKQGPDKVRDAIVHFVVHKSIACPIQESAALCKTFFIVILRLVKYWMSQLYITSTSDGDNPPIAVLDLLDTVQVDPRGDALAEVLFQVQSNFAPGCVTAFFHHHDDETDKMTAILPLLIGNYNAFVEILSKRHADMIALVKLCDVTCADSLFDASGIPITLFENKELPIEMVKRGQGATTARLHTYQFTLVEACRKEKEEFIVPIVSLDHQLWQDPVFLRISAACKINGADLGHHCDEAFINKCMAIVHTQPCPDDLNSEPATVMARMLWVLVVSRLARLRESYFVNIGIAWDEYVKRPDEQQDLECLSKEDQQDLEATLYSTQGAYPNVVSIVYRHNNLRCNSEGLCNLMGHQSSYCASSYICNRETRYSEATMLYWLLHTDALVHQYGYASMQNVWNVLDALTILELLQSYQLEMKNKEGPAPHNYFTSATQVTSLPGQKKLKNRPELNDLVAIYNTHVEKFWKGKNPRVTVPDEPIALAEFPPDKALKWPGAADVVWSADGYQGPMACKLMEPGYTTPRKRPRTQCAN